MRRVRSLSGLLAFLTVLCSAPAADADAADLLTITAVGAPASLTPAAPIRESPSWLSRQINGKTRIRVFGAWGVSYLEKPWLSGDTLTFAAIGSEGPDPRSDPARALAFREVNRIQVRASAAGRGACWGAIIGLVGGLAAGLGIDASLCGDSACDNEGGGIALIAIGSTAGGALVGAIVGAPMERWKTVYPRAE